MLLKTSNIGLESHQILSYFKLFYNVKFLVGFVFYALSFCVWILLLAKRDLSYIYPIVIGLSYFFIMISSALFLKEQFTFIKFIGAALILVGVFFIYTQK
jgi:multidrug transporter EmrE-like cation transporter